METTDPRADVAHLLSELTRALTKAAAMPRTVPPEYRLSDAEWAEAVVVRGEAPYGRCAWCNAALGAAGCLNLCDMPAGAAREFTNGLLAVLAARRAKIVWVEALGGCTCGPAHLSGYQIERDTHDRTCPMNPGEPRP